jgi:hypothetical protein
MFRLALALGRTVAELEETMSGRELTEWMAYDSLEPFGEQRADLRSGIVASTIANCHRSRGPAFKPQDFMPFVEKPSADPATALHALRKAFGKGGN